MDSSSNLSFNHTGLVVYKTEFYISYQSKNIHAVHARGVVEGNYEKLYITLVAKTLNLNSTDKYQNIQ